MSIRHAERRYILNGAGEDFDTQSAVNGYEERKYTMHFVVIGTGGIGGYYGARLQAHGQLVTFIARGTHLQAMQTGGLRVNHPEWRFDAPVKACSLEQFFQSSLTPEVDLIILCVKAIDTEAIAPGLQTGSGSRPRRCCRYKTEWTTKPC